MSQALAISIPAPIQYPWIAQITGTLHFSSTFVYLCNVLRPKYILYPILATSTSSLTSEFFRFYSIADCKSSPEVKCFPFVDKITTLISYSVLSISLKTLSISLNISKLIAFIYFGLLNITIATPFS